MQASNKTYYHQLKYQLNSKNNKWDIARTEREYRCAATELYKYWGFKDVLFANGDFGANAVIAIDDKIVIALRGTQNPGAITGIFDVSDVSNGLFSIKDHASESVKGTVDVMMNLNHAKISAKNIGVAARGKVHAGYAIAAKEIYGLLSVVEPFVKIKKNIDTSNP